MYADTGKPIPGYGDNSIPRPCINCGKIFEGSNMGDVDPCLGELPGVDAACCGHGGREKSYIRFTNGVVITNFQIEKN